jgi:beta-galactosidase
LHYADWITPTTAKALARYDQPHLKEFAAVTRNQLGDGVGWYVGTIVEDAGFYDKLIARILHDAEIQPLGKPPAGVELAMRQGAQRRLLFVINHTAHEQTIAVPDGNRDLLNDEYAGGSIKLQPFGVAIIELPAADARRGE